ncbi:MAG: polyphosphate kinase 1, partial [Candidatus Aminicenantes bacterium]|nr:polyphosphate kinase 1 [Candidatus Aminicenantes bacterium]
MPDHASIFLNRELSWLEFNRRVLEEARDDSLPILERLKFLAISGSNMDEFFMVRVGGLQMLAAQGRDKPDLSGYTPASLLKEIRVRTESLVEDQYDSRRELEGLLSSAGIRRRFLNELTPGENAFLERLFIREILPILTPVAVSADRPFPALAGLRLNLLLRFRTRAGGKEEPRSLIVTLPKGLARFVALPAENGHHFLLLEEVVARFADRFVQGEDLLESVPFRVLRNAKMAVREDQAADLLAEMKQVLVERKQSACVRLEIDAGASAAARAFLRKTFAVPPDRLALIPGPLDISAYFRLANQPGFDALKIEPWTPQPLPEMAAGRSLFEILGRKDILLFHPYDDFAPVERLIAEAADDPQVLAVKQILYRTGEDSPIVASLIRAAERDKHVTAVVELKARFDEARNMVGAVELEQAGAQVIYGVRGLKTHAKICIIVRRESSGIRRYLHFSTGNYNEKTARLYSDVGYMTCREDYAADASAFFNTITGLSQSLPYLKLEAAPLGLKNRLLEMIDGEAERSKQGQTGLIRAKMNSLSDPEIIQALYRASQAGVEVLLNVRGVCCLRPGVPGLSEHITVVSIVDRFLEHGRILHFHNGGTEKVFISSADWMPRNLERRVELLVPIEEETCRRRLTAILDVFFQDNVKARRLQPDGAY